MKARPIIFQGDMVRAILDGRKTQTRRAAKLTAGGHVKEPNGNRRWHPDDANAELACPYGQPGDQLWVRETFAEHPDYAEVFYAADGDEFLDADGSTFIMAGNQTPSIFMPRKLSRLTLRITGVRVERVQEISEGDAAAEGAKPASDLLPDHPGTYLTPAGDFATARVAFQRLWESINGLGSWDENPWVWVIAFEPIRANVDDAIAELSPRKGINYA